VHALGDPPRFRLGDRFGPTQSPAFRAFVQRFGGALNLNVHFHCVIPDGVFVQEVGSVRFGELAPPSDDDLIAVSERCRPARPKSPEPERQIQLCFSGASPEYGGGGGRARRRR
jgi:Putative transposase